MPVRADEGLRLVGEPAGYAEIADAIEALPGVVTHGLFVGVATSAVIPGPGGARALHRVRMRRGRGFSHLSQFQIIILLMP